MFAFFLPFIHPLLVVDSLIRIYQHSHNSYFSNRKTNIKTNLESWAIALLYKRIKTIITKWENFAKTTILMQAEALSKICIANQKKYLCKIYAIFNGIQCFRFFNGIPPPYLTTKMHKFRDKNNWLRIP